MRPNTICSLFSKTDKVGHIVCDLRGQTYTYSLRDFGQSSKCDGIWIESPDDALFIIVICYFVFMQYTFMEYRTRDLTMTTADAA